MMAESELNAAPDYSTDRAEDAGSSAMPIMDEDEAIDSGYG